MTTLAENVQRRTVDVDVEIAAPASEVWSVVLDIESYPQYMTTVRRVDIVHDDDGHRVSEWSVILKGSVLEWTESEVVDHDAMRIKFHQLDGDLDVFEGFWSVEASDEGPTRVRMHVEFDIGIRLLAEMLNPVAERALRENALSMLRALEARTQPGAV